jgi:hypothetical protein
MNLESIMQRLDCRKTPRGQVHSIPCRFHTYTGSFLKIWILSSHNRQLAKCCNFELLVRRRVGGVVLDCRSTSSRADRAELITTSEVWLKRQHDRHSSYHAPAQSIEVSQRVEWDGNRARTGAAASEHAP